MDTTPFTFQIEYSTLDITQEHMAELMGFFGPERPPQEVTCAITELLDKGRDLCNIRGGYVLVPGITVDQENKRIFSHGEWFETKQVITHQLRRSEQVAWFVCTAGENISTHARHCMEEGDLISGYVADIFANTVVESAMDMIQETIKNRMLDQGLKITNRYSPGYCEWLVDEQNKLFKVFPPNYLDITLSDSCLMIPVKSVSGIIGIGKEVKYNLHTCHYCGDKTCLYRNKRTNELYR
ncbi:MAG: vitamin B12 dependent-methionine synthase activation domain-containing protein [Bacteroidales bacterium]